MRTRREYQNRDIPPKITHKNSTRLEAAKRSGYCLLSRRDRDGEPRRSL